MTHAPESRLLEPASSTREDLVRLTGDWALWRWAGLRGAGFPVSLVERLAAPEAARAVDELIDAEDAVTAARTRAIDALRMPIVGLTDRLAQRRRARARKRVAKGALPEPAEVDGFADVELAALRAASARAGAARAAVEQAFAIARAEASRALGEVIADPRFREAVTWQNRTAVETAITPLLRQASEDGGGWRRRQREELVASYLHRYATKNDTIGFFGPLGWVRFEGSERLVLRSGPALLATRQTYFEQWGIDVLADRFAEDPRMWPWLAPERFGFVRLEGATAQSPLTGPQRLSRAEALVLAACDGRRTTRELGAALSRDHHDDLPTPSSVDAILRELQTKQLVRINLDLRTTLGAERVLRARLERIDDVELRDECKGALDELESARRAIAEASGDPDRLSASLARLEERFHGLTGAEPTRHAGRMYASRTLVFEDCRRDLDATIGERLLAEIGPALGLMLTSARFLTRAIGEAYQAAFRELFAAMTRRTGARSVPFSDFWFRAQRLFYGAKGSLIDEIARGVRERWGRILAIPLGTRRVGYRSDELRAAVEAAFDAPRAGWSCGRHHSPDLMIAASSAEAIARGEYYAVLGEIHVAVNTLDVWAAVSQHPSPDDLARSLARDIPEPRVTLVHAKDGIRSPVRTSQALSTPNDFELETNFHSSKLDPPFRLRLGELELELSGERLCVVSPGTDLRIDLLELVGSTTLGGLAANALELLPPTDHGPRVTIDNVVVHRETWRVAPAAMTFAFADAEVDRFVGARRWARALGCPRYAFARSRTEVKPIFVDFHDPIAVNILARLVRRAAEGVGGGDSIKIVEMLPAPDEAWLPDAAGHRYTSELRVVAVDQRR